MEEYAEVTIKFYAPQEEINGKNEGALADKIYQIEEALEYWLKMAVKDTKLTFKIVEKE